MPESPTFLQRTASWTLGLLAPTGAISWGLFGGEMALGVTLGALLGLANFAVLARSLSKVLQNPEEHRPAAGKKWVLPAAMVLKWPFLLLALGLILWYMPARPEGVALGVALSLVAASIAALRGSKQPSATNSASTT